MFSVIKRFLLVLLLLTVGGRATFGFTPLGPANETYQVQPIGYNLTPPASTLANEGGGSDVGAPKNIGEGYRYNTRTLYYSYDANFLNYFGSNGVSAIDGAFSILNNLSNVSSYSSDLNEWTMNSSRLNYRAQALSLLDLKSAALSMMVEEIGLAQPDRWAWALHDRFPIPGAPCPNVEYTIIERNFDPVTLQYTPYVNGVLYDYFIIELCGLLPANPFAPLLADAVETVVDPVQAADSYSAVAAANYHVGTFYTGLTRDDIGGLRYLMATNRMVVEGTETNTPSFLVSTTNSQSLIITSNLTTFTAQTRTNNPLALIGLYPTLQILSFSQSFSNAVTTNISAYFTNLSGSVAGSPPTPVLVTNFTTNAVTNFDYVFGNVVTNQLFSRGFVVVQQTNVVLKPGGFAGQLQTNVTSTTNLTPFVNGDFFIIPSNQCGFSIIATQLTTLSIITNTIVTATNAPGVTNFNGQFFTENILTFFTNHTIIVSIPQCISNSVALREGIEKINFVRQDFDSLLGQAWTPITNIYTLTAVTNFTPFVQTFYRVVTQPDFLITGRDLAFGPNFPLNNSSVLRSTPNYYTNLVSAGHGGPGILQPGITLTFNTVGPLYFNTGPFFIFPDGTAGFAQTNSFFNFQWGSFDGTTNDPVVYPNGASLANLEAQVVFQVTAGLLPVGSVSANTAGNPYTVQLQASGGQGPYSWILSDSSAALPDGLSLSASGVISGVPATTGIFDFVVQVTDSGGRVTQGGLFIEIDP